ncbi:MAG: hypothetical protein VCC00_03085 [Deltaproteobacteria bacterium]
MSFDELLGKAMEAEGLAQALLQAEGNPACCRVRPGREVGAPGPMLAQSPPGVLVRAALTG